MRPLRGRRVLDELIAPPRDWIWKAYDKIPQDITKPSVCAQSFLSLLEGDVLLDLLLPRNSKALGEIHHLQDQLLSLEATYHLSPVMNRFGDIVRYMGTLKRKERFVQIQYAVRSILFTMHVD